MPDLTEKMLSEHIKKSEFMPVYLLYGNENYLKRYYADAIIQKAVTDLPDLNLHRFDGALKVDDIVNAGETLPAPPGQRHVGYLVGHCQV